MINKKYYFGTKIKCISSKFNTENIDFDTIFSSMNNTVVFKLNYKFDRNTTTQNSEVYININTEKVEEILHSEYVTGKMFGYFRGFTTYAKELFQIKKKYNQLGNDYTEIYKSAPKNYLLELSNLNKKYQ